MPSVWLGIAMSMDGEERGDGRQHFVSQLTSRGKKYFIFCDMRGVIFTVDT